MIVTLTMNPSVDRTAQLPAPLAVGGVNRIAAVDDSPGGKGVNVARVVAAGSPGWATGETWQQPWLLLGLGLLLAFLPGMSVDPRTGRTAGEEPSRAEVEAHRSVEPSETGPAA